jgi:hypothetical protein
MKLEKKSMKKGQKINPIQQELTRHIHDLGQETKITS